MERSGTRNPNRDPDATFSLDATFVREEAAEGFRSFFAPYARLYAALIERAAVIAKDGSSDRN